LPLASIACGQLKDLSISREYLNFPGRMPAYGVTGEITASTGRPKNGKHSVSRQQVTATCHCAYSEQMTPSSRCIDP
jgi:hypothetical protein